MNFVLNLNYSFWEYLFDDEFFSNRSLENSSPSDFFKKS